MIWVRKTPAALGQTEYKSILLYSEVPNSTPGARTTSWVLLSMGTDEESRAEEFN